MRKCTELTKLLSDGMERPFTLAEQIEITLHTSMCRPCRQFRHNTKTLRELMHLHREHQASDSNKSG